MTPIRTAVLLFTVGLTAGCGGDRQEAPTGERASAGRGSRGAVEAGASSRDGATVEPAAAVIQYSLGQTSSGQYLLLSGGEVAARTKDSVRQAVDVLLEEVPEQTYLDVDATYEGLTREEYAQLAHLEALRTLYVQTDQPVEGPELEPLLAMPNLTTLEFEEAIVRPSAMSTLARSETLRQFRYGSGQGVKEAAEQAGARFSVVGTGNYAP